MWEDRGMTRLDIPVTYNFRAVAGMREGTLYRSDALGTLTRAGREQIADLGITHVIDLRSDIDRRIGRQDRLSGTGAELIKIPVGAKTNRANFHEMTLDSLYRELINHNAPEFGHAIQQIAHAPGAVVIHCTAGKDRTGILSALIQLTVGIDEQTVIADYEKSNANLEGEWGDRMRRKFRRFRIPITPEFDNILVGSPAESLAAALAYIRTEHGGVDAYLDANGVTDAHREALASRRAG